MASPSSSNLFTSPQARSPSTSSLTRPLANSPIPRQTSTSPQNPRRRQNSHLHSTLFSSTMTLPLSYLPPHRASSASANGHGDNDNDFGHRDHTLTSFEWRIQGVKWLKEHVEGQAGGLWTVEAEMNDPEGLPEALRRGVVVGEGGYKLDIARTIPAGHSPKSTVEEIAETVNPETHDPRTLSLYIATLILENQPLNYMYTSSIFVGIRPTETNTGQRYATSNWIWTHSAEWEFSKDNEFWEVELPKLSGLLEKKEVDLADEFMICIQIGSPARNGPGFGLPDQLVLPQSVIEGLRGLVDSPTGDVRFVCLEHVPVPSEGEEGKAQTMSRRRVLYAHSDVLKARGDYFKDLLTGGFAESEVARRGETRYTTILVHDAGFDTVYWMLRFIYTNQLIFRDTDDVRLSMDQVHLDKNEITKLLTGTTSYHLGSPGEWDFRSLPIEGEINEEEFETRTVKSVSSAGTSVSRRVSGISISPPRKPPIPTRDRSTSSSTSASTNISKVSTSSMGVSKAPSRISTNTPSATPTRTRTTTATSSTTAKPSTRASKSPTQTSPSAQPARSHYPLPIARHHPEPDPHVHPTSEPSPASALSVYMLSHRYRLEGLESLAKDHILERTTAENCMPMLLASYQYEELHAEVLDFVVENWSSVQAGQEFFKCIQEVSAGVWGEAGGLVLHGLFKRL